MKLAFGGLLLALAWWALWRLTTNAASVHQVIARASGHFLEIGLYKDQPRAMAQSLWELQRVSLRLAWVLLAPSLLFVFPLVLVVVYLGACYSHRPLLPGESAVLSVRGLPQPVELALHPSLLEEAGPVVRELEGGGQETLWRIKGMDPGSFQVSLSGGEVRVLKRVTIGQPGGAVNSVRSSRWLDWLKNPTEMPLDREVEIRLDYPRRELWFGDRQVPWWFVLVCWFLIFVSATGKFLARG